MDCYISKFHREIKTDAWLTQGKSFAMKVKPFIFSWILRRNCGCENVVTDLAFELASFDGLSNLVLP